MDYRLLEEAAQEWESYARDLADWRRRNGKQATWRSGREAMGHARRLRRLLPLTTGGLEVSLVRSTRAREED